MGAKLTNDRYNGDDATIYSACNYQVFYLKPKKLTPLSLRRKFFCSQRQSTKHP